MFAQHVNNKSCHRAQQSCAKRLRMRVFYLLPSLVLTILLHKSINKALRVFFEAGIVVHILMRQGGIKTMTAPSNFYPSANSLTLPAHLRHLSCARFDPSIALHRSWLKAGCQLRWRGRQRSRRCAAWVGQKCTRADRSWHPISVRPLSCAVDFTKTTLFGGTFHGRGCVAVRLAAKAQHRRSSDEHHYLDAVTRKR